MLVATFSGSSHPAQRQRSSSGAILSPAKNMNTLHSFLENLATAGSLYGWRMDAILLGSTLWALTAGSAHLRLAISH
jgi:hypothetical protein